MKKWKITGYTKIEVKTIVEANSEEEAQQIAQDREADLCFHGTEDYDCEEDWRLVEVLDYPTVDLIEEYEDNE